MSASIRTPTATRTPRYSTVDRAPRVRARAHPTTAPTWRASSITSTPSTRISTAGTITIATTSWILGAARRRALAGGLAAPGPQGLRLPLEGARQRRAELLGLQQGAHGARELGRSDPVDQVAVGRTARRAQREVVQHPSDLRPQRAAEALARQAERRIERHAGLDADPQQVEQVRQLPHDRAAPRPLAGDDPPPRRAGRRPGQHRGERRRPRRRDARGARPPRRRRARSRRGRARAPRAPARPPRRPARWPRRRPGARAAA